MKRFLAFIFILSMFLTICIPIYAMEINEGYADIKGHWARTEVDKWSEKGLLKGSNGKFNPNNHITRAEMAVIIDRLMDYGETETNVFEDLSGTWYTEAILKNSRAGVMKGFDGYIRPMDSITRQEAVVMISRAMEIEEKSGNTSFADDSMIASWAKGYVKAFSDLGYISGMPDGSFAPNRPVTRAAVVKIVDNMIAKWINEKGEYSEDINGILIINSEDVTLKDMTIDGNLIIAQGVAGGEIYLDNVTVTGDVFVKGGGENSVYFNDTKINGTLEVSKTDGRIRIVAKGSTVAKVTKLLTGAILVENYTTGIGFERVEVPKEAAENSDIDIEGDITILNVSAKGTNVNILKDTKVGRADLSAEGSKLNVLGEVNNVNINSGADNTSIIGSGKVTNVKVNANDVSVTTDKTKVTAGGNVTGVTADGKKVNAGKTVKTGGTSSSGGSSSGGTTQPTNHAPTVVVGKESHTGTATPAHGSGTPMAATYQIDVNSWFADSDTSDTLTYAVASTTSSDAANIVINGSSLTYTPSFEDRDSNIEIQVKANDGIADSTANAVITITVGSVPNSAPVPVNTTQTGNATPSSIDETTAPVQSYIADMSAWFIDSDNDNLTYIVVSNTGNGTVNITNSTLEYAPSIADEGFNIDVVIKANDGMTDSSDNVTVTVVVGAIPNSKPTLSNQVVTGTAISASRDGLISSIAYNEGLMSYFEDVDLDTLTYRIVSENANGDVSLNGSTIIFTPTTADADSDITIIVKANDGTIDSDNLTITVEVDDIPNSSPVKDSDVPDYNSLIIGNAVNIDLSQHFSDADVTANADILSYSINPSLPSGLTLNTSAGVISGAGSKMSQTSFTVTAKDSHNAAVTDEFDMTISLPVQGTKVREDSGTWVIDDTNGTHIGLWSVEDLIKINENTGTFLLSGDYVLMTHLDFEEDDSYRDETMADTNDIDGDSDTTESLKNALMSTDNGAGFKPIGNNSSKFLGTFDGDDHTMSNLYINRPSSQYVGLFGYSGEYTYNPTTPYTIKNIGLINPTVAGQSSTAFISGGSNANIEGCYVESGTLSSSGNYCGGIVGQANGAFIRIKRCYVKDITINSSGAYVAGILARASSDNYLVENCYSTGTINPTHSNVGGITGAAYDNIRNCYSTMKIEASSYDSAGGIAGYTWSGTNLQNCIAMNPYIKGGSYKPNTLNRVAGEHAGTITNSYAFNGMQLYSTPSTTTVTSNDATSVDGADMTIAQFLEADSYDNDSSSDNMALDWDTSIWNIQDGKRPTLIGVGNDEGSIDAGDYMTLPSNISPTFSYGSIVLDIDGADDNYAGYKDYINMSSSKIEFMDNDDHNNDISINLNTLGSRLASDGVITFDGSPIDHEPCLVKSGEFATGGVLEAFDMEVHDKVKVSLVFTDPSNTTQSGEANIPTFGDTFTVSATPRTPSAITYSNIDIHGSYNDIEITARSLNLPFGVNANTSWTKLTDTDRGDLEAYIYTPTTDIENLLVSANVKIFVTSDENTETLTITGTGGGNQFIDANKPVIVLIIKDTDNGLMKPYTCYIESVDANTVRLVPLTKAERNALTFQ